MSATERVRMNMFLAKILNHFKGYFVICETLNFPYLRIASLYLSLSLFSFTIKHWNNFKFPILFFLPSTGLHIFPLFLFLPVTENEHHHPSTLFLFFSFTSISFPLFFFFAFFLFLSLLPLSFSATLFLFIYVSFYLFFLFFILFLQLYFGLVFSFWINPTCWSIPFQWLWQLNHHHHHHAKSNA